MRYVSFILAIKNICVKIEVYIWEKLLQIKKNSHFLAELNTILWRKESLEKSGHLIVNLVRQMDLEIAEQDLRPINSGEKKFEKNAK